MMDDLNIVHPGAFSFLDSSHLIVMFLYTNTLNKSSLSWNQQRRFVRFFLGKDVKICRIELAMAQYKKPLKVIINGIYLMVGYTEDS